MTGLILKLSYNYVGDSNVVGGICGSFFFLQADKAITANHVLNRPNFKPNEGFALCQFWLIIQPNYIIELKAENLSATSKANIRAKYRNLDKLAEIQLQKEIAQIANNALKNQNDLQLAAANETFSTLISQLDFFYDEVFAQYRNLNTNDIFKVFFVL